MKDRNIVINLVIIAILVLVTVIESFTQNTLRRRCPGIAPPIPNAVVAVERDGDIVMTPCEGQATNITTGTLTASELRLLNPAYTTWQSAKPYMTIGANNRFAMPADRVTAIDMNLPVTFASTSRHLYGQRIALDVLGSPSLPPQVVGLGVDIFSNSFFANGTGSLIGVNSAVDVGGPVSDAIGGNFSAATGSSAASGVVSIFGVKTLTSIHNTGATNVFTGDFWWASSPSSPASTVANAYVLRTRARVNENVTATNLRFLSMAESSKTTNGSVINSFGIYADSTIDLGTTQRWFIYSTSASPSRFGANVYFPTNAQGIVLTAPNGTSCYRIDVANDGTLSTTQVSCNPFAD